MTKQDKLLKPRAVTILTNNSVQLPLRRNASVPLLASSWLHLLFCAHDNSFTQVSPNPTNNNVNVCRSTFTTSVHINLHKKHNKQTCGPQQQFQQRKENFSVFHDIQANLSQLGKLHKIRIGNFITAISVYYFLAFWASLLSDRKAVYRN